MSNFPNNDYETEEIEKLAISILIHCGIECFQNNVTDHSDVDICTKNGIKIDVQYSNDFAKFGDLRLDTISSYTPKQAVPNPKYIYDHNKNIIRNFQEKYSCQVDKSGKVFQKDYVDFLLVLFYNKEYTIQNKNPDYVLLISKNDIVNYCKPRVEFLFNHIITNNKKAGTNKVGSNDKHGSAFIPLDINDLLKNTNCIFETYDDFPKYYLQVQQYLNHSTY